jgi:hypothetical protein
MRKTLLTILLISIFLPFVAQAGCEGPLVPCGTSTTPPCTLCHLFELLNNILDFLLTCLAPIVAVLMFTIGGLLFILSQFDIVSANIFSQAKGIVTAVVVGLVIIFASYIFLNAFLSTIGYADWTGLGTWWQINCQ